MHKSYKNLITEDLISLNSLNKRLSSSRLKVRLRMLILLKSGKYTSLFQLSLHLGYHHKSLENWFRIYEQSGINHLLKLNYWQRPSSLDNQPLLNKKLQIDGFDTIYQAQKWIATHLSIDLGYEAVRSWFIKQKVKLKTGRPVHIQQDKQALEDFKKTLVH